MKRVHGHGDGAVGGQKENRQLRAAAHELVLHVEPREARHAYVEHDAAWAL